MPPVGRSQTGHNVGQRPMSESAQSPCAPAAPSIEARLRALQVDELYRFGPTATASSYLGAMLTLGVLIDTGDLGRGSVWFLYATVVTFFRMACILAYRRRDPASDPEPWARALIAANFLAGLQWAALGTLLFPAESGYRQIFTVMVIASLVGGSLPAYSSVRWAHEALSIPAAVPMVIYVFFVQDGVHAFAGVAGLFFCASIVSFSRRLNRYEEQSFRLRIERDDLVALTGQLNEKLVAENRALAHRAAVRGMSIESARERAGRLETLFENSPLPQLECDGRGRIITVNGAAERLFGARHGALAGTPFADLLCGAHSDARARAGARRAMNVELEVRGPAGAPLACTGSFTPLPAPEGLEPGFAVLLCGLCAPADVK